MVREPRAGRAARRFGPAVAFLLVALSGCRSVDPTAGLSPAAEIGAGPSTSSTGEEVPAPITATAPATSVGPVQFLPVVGAPVPVVETLSAALGAEAARAGVGIAPADAPPTPLRLKGYLSALGEGRETVVVFVWDVVDPAGNRISRIQGQERGAGQGTAADPWAGVSQATLSAIARRTIGELARLGTAG
ncbi:hypothetical protein ASG54_06035 [Aureimonas sp. Leaf460]|nr:hypothetical protein ASG62_20215 [Aureimonas sp. Leaf427]KQT81003.1 hypothetical protein ASG54_06035 [Aureimonas sp. Leaf460]